MYKKTKENYGLHCIFQCCHKTGNPSSYLSIYIIVFKLLISFLHSIHVWKKSISIGFGWEKEMVMFTKMKALYIFIYKNMDSDEYFSVQLRCPSRNTELYCNPFFFVCVLVTLQNSKAIGHTFDFREVLKSYFLYENIFLY